MEGLQSKGHGQWQQVLFAAVLLFAKREGKGKGEGETGLSIAPLASCARCLENSSNTSPNHNR